MDNPFSSATQSGPLDYRPSNHQ